MYTDLAYRAATMMMTADDVRAMLKRACRDAGTATEWADLHNVSKAYVSDVLNGRREPGPAICEAFGLEAVRGATMYRKIKQ